MSTTVVIDTDPGVDDALAILMAWEYAADVRALTVAAGNVGLEHTVRNARKLVDLSGQTTPVYPGCPTPLVQMPTDDAAFVHGSDGFGDVGFAEPSAQALPEHAAQALVRLAREHPGQLTLVALAPLTNLALALRLDPSLPDHIARLVIMGGAVNGHGNTMTTPTEFNIGFDPEAAHVVFEGFPEFDLVDWEVTLRHAIDDAQFEHWLDAGDARATFLRAIVGKSRTWNAQRGRHGLVAADALAMAVALDPDAITASEHHHVSVEMDGSLTRGATVVDWEDRLGKPANARIVLDVDHERFAAMVRRALGVN